MNISQDGTEEKVEDSERRNADFGLQDDPKTLGDAALPELRRALAGMVDKHYWQYQYWNTKLAAVHTEIERRKK